ncbi:ABC-2 type transport system ATP-binding protein [Plantibacter flavus]|uniref:ABC-2 type transport system ATP-binding protein n=1 Tax=Plantibacter flavus TaxID=150123 RepID=A0A3N2C115_9MICO|nr:ABC transporter ATP-binding protein [Plantibacter flavus]ROR81198.1 ABC-2 type transport system ATP-binding protein [Plantibacter flavus]SMG09110.1 ABC-2 type transport system ATP-binding protein [Plantibacter flavus]
MTITPLATLEGVTRRYGDVTALDDVDLRIEPGSLVGLLGPNGAGKSTVLSLLQGTRCPTTGTVTLFGGDPAQAVNRTRLGSTPQETALPPTLRVGEVVDFVGRHFADRVPTAALAEQFGFGDLLRRQTGSLSGGQQRRLAVALAFVGRPRLVLLDEPTTGLDVDARRTLWDAIRRQHELGATIVLTSHYLEEIEALAERVVVLGGGRVITDARLRDVLGLVGIHRVRLRSTDPGAVERLAGVVQASRDGDAVELDVRDADAFVRDLVRSEVPFTDLAVRGATLEEAFLTLTADARADVERSAA